MRVINLKQPIDKNDKIVNLCLEFLQQNGGKSIMFGKHEVDGGIFVNISEYQTDIPEQREWEAHIEYVDFQLVLEGKEYVYVSDIHKMKTSEYDPDRDYIQCFGKEDSCIALDENIGVVLMPEDAHKPSLTIGSEPSYVKKAVFKIPITYCC